MLRDYFFFDFLTIGFFFGGLPTLVPYVPFPYGITYSSSDSSSVSSSSTSSSSSASSLTYSASVVILGLLYNIIYTNDMKYTTATAVNK